MTGSELIARTIRGYEPSEEELRFYGPLVQEAVRSMRDKPPEHRMTAWYDYAATTENEREMLEDVWRAGWEISNAASKKRR